MGGCGWTWDDGARLQFALFDTAQDFTAAPLALIEHALSAITGRSWCAQSFPHWAALDDWFTATNLNSASARPGQDLTLTDASRVPASG